MQFVWRGKPYFPDLGAERVIAAERGTERVAVEIKSFIGQDFGIQFYETLGQYDSYYYALAELEPDRTVWIAITQQVWKEFFLLDHVQELLNLKKIPVLVVDIKNETIVQWIR